MKKKNSKLSIIAFVLCLTAVFGIIGAVLAIIDLAKKDKDQSHAFSIIGLGVLGAYILGVAFSDGSGSASVSNSSSSVSVSLRSSVSAMTNSSLESSSAGSLSSESNIDISGKEQSISNAFSSQSDSQLFGSSISAESVSDVSSYNPDKVNYSTAPVINGAKTAQIGTYAYYLYPGTKKDFSNDDLAKFAKANVDGLSGTYNYFVLVFDDNTCIFWSGCEIFIASYGTYSDQKTYLQDDVKYFLSYDYSNNTYTKSDN